MIKYLLLLLLISCNKKIVHPIKGEIVEAVYGLGTVSSERIFHAKAAIVASVKEFYVIEGQDVKKGQKLFTTDQETTVLAPFDGRVTDIEVSIGENLFLQTQILTIIDLDKLFLSVSLEQQATMRIRPGLAAEVSFEFFRNKKILGKITTIYPSKDQFIAKVQLDEWPKGVLTGMTADVAFEIDRKKDVTLIPVNSIANGNIVIKRDGKKEKLSVQVGLVDSEKAEIISPELRLGDEILLP
jgi:macrolide-specific efflux system membrane fusion protein